MAHFTKTIRRTGILLSTAAATTAFAAHYAEAYLVSPHRVLHFEC